MIHDLLLACLSHSPDVAGLKAFTDTSVVEHFIHPCEKQIFMEILKIINVYNEVIRYTHAMGLKEDKPYENNALDQTARLHGFYLINFCKGIESALEDYYDEIICLESFCSKNKTCSLTYVYNALQLRQPMLVFLRKLIMEVEVKKLRGCAMLNNLHQQSEHGDVQLETVINKVMKPVKSAFFSSMAHWMLFGVIDDVHSEFFIQFTPLDTANSSSCIKSSNSSLMNVDKNGEDYIWQYEINMSQLPGFLSSVVAEKILFVGQTVLVFQMERNFHSKRKSDHLSVKLSELSRADIYLLWNGRESEFFKLVENLSNDDKINAFHIENVVNQIKKYVSKRLSEIALNEVDLERQLVLIKDFYLFGRGEFYWEFLAQLNGSIENNCAETIKNYPRSFQLAATLMGIADDLENFSLSCQNSDPDESCEFHILQCLSLKYTFQWPLNLLFSPKVMERYNTIFRFLLIIRNLQYEMQRAWSKQTWNAKAVPGDINVKALILRNHLMFFLNTLQYYIQVDVLESQFGILMNVIKTKADFEEIQRAHTVFLANVLSQCFLLTDSRDGQMSITRTACQSQNPIYGTILKLFNVCEQFNYINQKKDTEDDFTDEIIRLEKDFGVQIESLIKLLVDAKTASTLGPLSQLLLRLDFNHWFSAKQNTVTLIN